MCAIRAKLHPNLVKITELLSDGHYHDGTSMGNHLNISRAAVWKVVKKLEQYAIPLDSVKGKGYRLESPLILLNHQKIKAQLRHQSVHFDVLEKIGSTNHYLEQFILQNKKIRACMAETQSQGKGRLHRQWYSPFGENIYLSVLCPFEKDISELSGLSLVTGLATCQALESTVKIKKHCLKIKWPNDIVIDHQKLAGILIEIQAESNGYCQVIIGIGVNVNMRQVPNKTFSQPWSSLFKMTRQSQDRNSLCAALIDTLIDYLERFSSGSWLKFVEEWKKRDSLVNTTIAVLTGDKKLKGICLGVNDRGHLLLKTEDQGILTVSSGDTTVLK